MHPLAAPRLRRPRPAQERGGFLGNTLRPAGPAELEIERLDQLKREIGGSRLAPGQLPRRDRRVDVPPIRQILPDDIELWGIELCIRWQETCLLQPRSRGAQLLPQGLNIN